MKVSLVLQVQKEWKQNSEGKEDLQSIIKRKISLEEEEEECVSDVY